jgi:hypothetical protein
VGRRVVRRVQANPEEHRQDKMSVLKKLCKKRINRLLKLVNVYSKQTRKQSILWMIWDIFLACVRFWAPSVIRLDVPRKCEDLNEKMLLYHASKPEPKKLSYSSWNSQATWFKTCLQEHLWIMQERIPSDGTWDNSLCLEQDPLLCGQGSRDKSFERREEQSWRTRTSSFKANETADSSRAICQEF